ncbi:GGDEF domain-containing protein, partial [Klebsiella pneumoniae]
FSDQTSLCLLVIDLDFFKSINDQFGHDTGDKVLIETTRLFTQVVGDNNLYRIGGEEFCVTLFDQSLEQA